MEGMEGGQILLTAQKSYDYTWELFSLVCRILITVLLEIGIALLFGFRGRKLLLTILGVNVVTQVTLNVILNVINYHQGFLAFLLGYFFLEFLVFVIETIAYAFLFKRSPLKGLLFQRSFSIRCLPIWLRLRADS